jgi:hypothetical protein
MPPVLSSSQRKTQRPDARRGAHVRPLLWLSTPARQSDGIVVGRPLAGYLDSEGRARELLALPGHAGSVLVLDRDAATLCDRRLVAHIAADEPSENAEIVCRHYLEDTHGRWCRRVRREDLEIVPLVGCVPETDTRVVDPDSSEDCVVDSDGNAYRIGVLAGERSTAQLRWCRRLAGADEGEWEQIGLREVVAALESYEPMRTRTEQAIASHQDHPGVLLTRLRGELERLCTSPLVLNRALREAVLEAIECRGMSMSEIALRCGIVKHDRRGKRSGETSWLARRVGTMPEGGEQRITPWVHSDVLAVIARKGLGISPREVELQ